MKQILLLAILLSFVIVNAQDKFSRPMKTKGILVYVMCEPVDDYEVVADLTTTSLQVITEIGSTNSTDAQNIEQLVENMVNRAKRKAKKGKIESFDAIITHNGDEGTLIKFIEPKTEYLARPAKVKGVLVYVMGEPVDDYEVVTDLTTSSLQVITAIGSDDSTDAPDIVELVDNIVDRAKRKAKKGKIDSFDAIITKNGDDGTIVKFIN